MLQQFPACWVVASTISEKELSKEEKPIFGPYRDTHAVTSHARFMALYLAAFWILEQCFWDPRVQICQPLPPKKYESQMCLDDKEQMILGQYMDANTSSIPSSKTIRFQVFGIQFLRIWGCGDCRECVSLNPIPKPCICRLSRQGQKNLDTKLCYSSFAYCGFSKEQGNI